MKILHLTSDWKWTGPAEPMLRLALAQRDAGEQVFLACPAGSAEGLATRARDAGLAPRLELESARGVRLLRDRAEVARLRGLLEEEQIDIVHTWHTRDHVLGLRAAALRRRRGATKLVRSFRLAEKISQAPWNRWLFGLGTDGLLCVSPETARRNASIRVGRPTRGVFGAVDLARFAPVDADPRVRESLGLKPEHRVVGIVARVQGHRRFDLLLTAAARWFARDGAARLLVVGRGTKREEFAERPARELGIEDRVIFAGYRRNDYADVLRCMDVFTFLVPGSDGTCRALLEAAACGIPAVTSKRGALPEIIADGKTGILCDEDPDALVAAWERLFADEAATRAMGNAAAQRARAHFSPEGFAGQVSELYAEVLGK